MDYSLDIFFRQLWVDKRLQFDLSADGINELVIGSDMLHKIWLPDTFIGNYNDNFNYCGKFLIFREQFFVKPDCQMAPEQLIKSIVILYISIYFFQWAFLELSEKPF